MNDLAYCGMGDDASMVQAIVTPLVAKVTDALMPKMKEIVAEASMAAEPTIRTVIREDVMPKVGMYAVLGLAAAAAVGAFVGALVARR
jgi:hypothetical protein